ncbi:hypothetical protein LQ564_12850 [Massilia sp. G4R7]|uniref:Uncharacterized protein n=1 Tax=Massilia phyllostachyos TaxID=2898585 RepID=A0ABS8Q628_9BURK|nr:hypothetical protein [Massilia phyllostachyos]MCD2517196.1 hypothetical protein [Massilia phyllostachyos]
MTRLLTRVIPVLACLAGLSTSAFAQSTQPATVTVQSTRDPVDKSYRKMIRGMERFERERAMAPNAPLRFQLLPRLPTVDMRGITLRVAGNTVSVPVAVAEDNSFVLPRNDVALREDAAVLANRKTTSMTWRAQIVTPGLPLGTRRLGDMRLECRVGVEAGLVSNSSPLFAWINNALTSPEQVCGSPNGNYLYFADRPLFAVRLHDAKTGRVETLPFNMLYAGGEQSKTDLQYCDCQVMLDRTFYAPIWDASWPDDTLVEFEYMEDGK